MKNLNIFIFAILVCIVQSCSAPLFIHHKESYDRQVDLQKHRASKTIAEIVVGVATAGLSVALETDMEYYPAEQEFKKLKLINTSSDTMYVNMLCDVFWDKENYCDFMDIRIPPNLICKILVPLHVNYNLYYSTTLQNNDDEMLEIFTGYSYKSRIKLPPTVNHFEKDSFTP